MDHIELKAAFTIDDTGAIEGIAWPFGSADRVGDEIMPGAFRKSVGPIPMMAFHDQKETVGVWDSITETAQGLVVKGQLLINEVARAREILALVKRKALPALSIGFATRKAAPRRGGGRTISDLVLLEISIVAIGAHPGALITSAKAAAAGKGPEHMDENEQDAAPDNAAIEAKWAKAEAIVTAVQSTTDKLVERLGKIEAKVNRPGGDKPDESEDAAVEMKAWLTYLRKGQQADDIDLKVLTVANDESAGYLAPAEVSSEFIRELTEISPIRQFASVRATTAPSVKYPKRTGITNAKWEGEIEEAEESTVTFGQTEIVAKRLTTYVDISNSLLMGSNGTAETEVRQAFVEDFGQKEGLAFVAGDGFKEPEGILTSDAVDYVANGHATNLSTDALIGLMYSLPAAYRSRGVWVLNGSSLATIRKLKDGQNNYIWQPSFQAGQPETILGRPVAEAVDMPDVEADAFPIAFGDLGTAYRIIDRMQLGTLTDPYTQAKRAITRIHGTRWVGGGVVQPAAIRKLKMATS